MKASCSHSSQQTPRQGSPRVYGRLDQRFGLVCQEGSRACNGDIVGGKSRDLKQPKTGTANT